MLLKKPFRRFLQSFFQALIVFPGRPFLVLFTHSQRKLHLKLLISLKVHGSAEPVHTGLSYLTGICQIGNRHKQYLPWILKNIICHLFLHLCKRMVGFLNILHKMVLLHVLTSCCCVLMLG